MIEEHKQIESIPPQQNPTDAKWSHVNIKLLNQFIAHYQSASWINKLLDPEQHLQVPNQTFKI